MKNDKLINKFKPVNWLTITLGQYMELMGLLKASEDVIKNGVTDMDIMFEIVRCLYGDEVEDLTLPEYSKLLASLNFLGTNIPKISVKKSYELGGKKYNCNMDLSKVIGNQYIDYMNYIRQEEGGNENLSKLVSVFLIPEGCKYGEGYDIKELQNLIEDEMKIIDVNAIAFFLPNFLNAYMVYTLKSSLQTMRKMMKKEKDQMKKEEIMKNMTEIENKMQQLTTML